MPEDGGDFRSGTAPASLKPCVDESNEGVSYDFRSGTAPASLKQNGWLDFDESRQRFPERNRSGLIEARSWWPGSSRSASRFPERNRSGLIEACWEGRGRAPPTAISGAEPLRPH